MKQKVITTMEDAIKICTNDVEIVGALSEMHLNIQYDLSKMIMNIWYNGIINVNDLEYLSFKGFISSYDTTIQSFCDDMGITMDDELRPVVAPLKAERFTCNINGERKIENYCNNDILKVFIKGNYTKHGIRCRYIAKSTQDYRMNALIKGVKNPDKRNEIIVINDNFHDVVLWGSENKNVTLIAELYSNGIMWQEIESDFDASDDVIDRAVVEHEIFLESLGGMK